MRAWCFVEPHGLAGQQQQPSCLCHTIRTPIFTGVVFPSRSVSPVNVCRTMASLSTIVMVWSVMVLSAPVRGTARIGDTTRN